MNHRVDLGHAQPQPAKHFSPSGGHRVGGLSRQRRRERRAAETKFAKAEKAVKVEDAAKAEEATIVIAQKSAKVEEDGMTMERILLKTKKIIQT